MLCVCTDSKCLCCSLFNLFSHQRCSLTRVNPNSPISKIFLVHLCLCTQTSLRSALIPIPLFLHKLIFFRTAKRTSDHRLPLAPHLLHSVLFPLVTLFLPLYVKRTRSELISQESLFVFVNWLPWSILCSVCILSIPRRRFSSENWPRHSGILSCSWWMVMWWSYGWKVDNQESLSELLDTQSIKKSCSQQDVIFHLVLRK